MKTKQLFTLAIIAFILVALAVRSSRQQQNAPPSVIGKKLLPSLAIDSVGRVEIAHKDARVTLVRGDDGWTITNLFNYPADLSKLQAALLKLSEQKIGEVARGVNVDTNATLVDLQGSSGKPLATLRLGNNAAPADPEKYRPAQGRYVAVAGNSQVYLVKDDLDAFDGTPQSWANNQLLNIQFADVQSIEITNPTNGTLTLLKNGGELLLQGIATNEEFDTSKSYGVESAFCYLNFTGIADPKLTDAQTGLTQPNLYRVKTKTGDQYTARIGSAAPNGERYLRLEAQLAPPGTNATAQADYATRKADLDQKFTKWTYLIASGSADNMTRSRAELVKPKVISTNTPPATNSFDAPSPMMNNP